MNESSASRPPAPSGRSGAMLRRAIGLLGVRDLIVVQTGDATLVCSRDAAQRVKELVRLLPPRLR